MTTDHELAQRSDDQQPGDVARGPSTPAGGGNPSTNSVSSAVRPAARPAVRGDLLTDLAEAVNALTRPSSKTEYVEVANVAETVTRRGKRRKSKRGVRVRRAHHTRLPSLLDQLRYADPPATVETGGVWTKGEFESKPPAELATLSTLREIVAGGRGWAATLGASPAGAPEDVLQRLVSAASVRDDGDELAAVTKDARRWVRRAKEALKLEAPSITLGDPCPHCWRKNCLVVAGDLESARCSRCGRSWTHDTIGLLASMLQTNQEQATAAAGPDAPGAGEHAAARGRAARCWMSDCVRLGAHLEHADDRGRTWGDTCPVIP